MDIANGNPYFLVATKQLGLYGQDDWKVNRRLTVNLGLRWDKDFNMIGVSDVQKSRTYLGLVGYNNPISNPYVSKLPHDDNKDFSPRVGFAYDVTGAGKHVVRGGVGLYYGNVFQNIPLFMEQMSNPTVFATVLSLTNPDRLCSRYGPYAWSMAIWRQPAANDSRSVHAASAGQHRTSDGSQLSQPGDRWSLTVDTAGRSTPTRWLRQNTRMFSVCTRTRPSISISAYPRVEFAALLR